jgi:proteic killer suppression protein
LSHYNYLRSVQELGGWLVVIKSFRHKGLKRLYENNDRKGVSPEMTGKVARVLARLDVAKAPEQMDLPGLKLHPLKGELKGSWLVSVSGNWRIIFRFEGTDATQVDLLDYH